MRTLFHCTFLALVASLLFSLPQPTFAQSYWLGTPVPNVPDTLRFDTRVPADVVSKMFMTPYAANKVPETKQFSGPVNGVNHTFLETYLVWVNNLNGGGMTWKSKEGLFGGQWENLNVNDPSWPAFRQKLETLATAQPANNGTWFHAPKVTIIRTNGNQNPNLTLNMKSLLSGVPFELGKAELPVSQGEEHPHEKCPQYIAHWTSHNNTIDLVFHDVSGKKIHLYTIDMKTPTPTARKWQELDSLGFLAGFVRTAPQNGQTHWYIATAQRNTGRDQSKLMKIYWLNGGPTAQPQTLWSAQVKSPLNQGTSQLALDPVKNRILAVFNQSPAHSFYVLLNSQQTNQTTTPHETLYHHNFDQRAFFDGQDFVVMENRDHDVTLTLMKINPTEQSPQQNGAWAQKVRSVFTTTNWGNSTYLNLGQIQNGSPQVYAGYLVLFAAERDWNDKFASPRFAAHWGVKNDQTPIPPGVASSRDLAAIHVSKNFDKSPLNWSNVKGDWLSQSPKMVDTTSMITSLGTPDKTVTYRTARDGWDWPNYTGTADLQLLAQQQGVPSWNDTTRQLRTKGIQWLTNYGANAEAQRQLPQGSFTTVERPKLIQTFTGNYIAVWEEHTCTPTQYGSFYGTPMTYQRTKAMRISLQPLNTGVRINATQPVILQGNPRVHWHDSIFRWHRSAAWFTGDSLNRRLILHLVNNNDLSYRTHSIQL